MKYFSSVGIRIKFRMQLRALNTKASQPISLIRLEDLILEELAGFSLESVSSKVFPQRLILDLSENLRQQSSCDKLKLFIRILRTRGRLRWICFNFFSQKFNFSVPFRLLKYGKITEINYFHSRF